MTHAVRIEYAVEFDEWYEAIAQLVRRRMMWRYVLWTFVLVAGLAMIVTSNLPRGGTAAVGAFVPGYAVLIVASHWMYRRRLRRVFVRTPALSEHVIADFNKHEARWTNPVKSSAMRWAGFSHWRETDLSFLLFRGPQYPLIVPKRAFLDESQLTAFRTLLSEKIGRTSADAGRAFPVEPGTSG